MSTYTISVATNTHGSPDNHLLMFQIAICDPLHMYDPHHYEQFNGGKLISTINHNTVSIIPYFSVAKPSPK